MPDTGLPPASGASSGAPSGAGGFDLKAHIRSVPDFPKPGILFYDISTLLRNGPAWRGAMDRLAEVIRPYEPTLLAGIESRGFLMAAPLALELGLGFIMLRKPRKLPGATIGYDYDLEYGQDRIEMQADALRPGERVVLLDDLLATGGTMAAAIQLLKRAGAEVPVAATLIELRFLNGRARIDVPVETLAAYDD
ncbi:adenine phosphoribosyltransferase [Pseudoroseomonas rhizosphaerae]|uniref:Adenine phosphoribosyltransferase n=1 Tax=Teichococcus rhizosphaerae TaxID=1335062 RepID=A0A2C6Y5R1_9PROT|nr:adenine phosphoribosyltransferase [Pseudoroseomonas rhizosphaerae]PHK96152.1 adenine phosphoribosyltransferase [Pseudoroseomonas rhizosphaerae]